MAERTIEKPHNKQRNKSKATFGDDFEEPNNKNDLVDDSEYKKYGSKSQGYQSVISTSATVKSTPTKKKGMNSRVSSPPRTPKKQKSDQTTNSKATTKTQNYLVPSDSAKKKQKRSRNTQDSQRDNVDSKMRASIELDLKRRLERLEKTTANIRVELNAEIDETMRQQRELLQRTNTQVQETKNVQTQLEEKVLSETKKQHGVVSELIQQTNTQIQETKNIQTQLEEKVTSETNETKKQLGVLLGLIQQSNTQIQETKNVQTQLEEKVISETKRQLDVVSERTNTHIKETKSAQTQFEKAISETKEQFKRDISELTMKTTNQIRLTHDKIKEIQTQFKISETKKKHEILESLDSRFVKIESNIADTTSTLTEKVQTLNLQLNDQQNSINEQLKTQNAAATQQFVELKLKDLTTKFQKKLGKLAQRFESRQERKQRKFRRELCTKYNLEGEVCFVTGSKFAVEAAHIKPWAEMITHPDVNKSKNGLLLSANWHTLFDEHQWSLRRDIEKEQLEIVLSEELAADELYKNYHTTSLGYWNSPILMKQLFETAGSDFIEEHYNKFLDEHPERTHKN